MHGRLKVYTTEEQKLLKQKEQQKQVVAYQEGLKTVLSSRKKGGYNLECLQICSKMLQRQPDVYTLWNYRKEATLLRLSQGSDESDSDDVVNFLQNELQLTQQCLLSNPKSYSSWHHRFWILERHPNPDWENEMSLCDQYLALDERNFHCWDYRRLILTKAGTLLPSEIKFSTNGINVNFSNYSSWHYRSTLKFLDADTLQGELALVQSAVFTDPYDSSAWFYLRWVMSDSNFTEELRKEMLQALNQLQDLEPNCRWILIAKCWFISDESEKEKCYQTLAKLDELRKGRYLKN